MLVRTANNHVDGHGMKKEKAEWVNGIFRNFIIAIDSLEEQIKNLNYLVENLTYYEKFSLNA